MNREDARNFRYELEPYRRGERSRVRHKCPRCGDPHSFTRYIDKETKEYIADEVGRCDHKNTDVCGYHLRPWEYFKQGGKVPPPLTEEQRAALAERQRQEEEQERLRWEDPDTLEMTLIQRLQSRLEQSVLFNWLVSKFDVQRVAAACADYYVGATRDGRSVFPQIDRDGRCRTAKVMRYGSDGHRAKEGINLIRWVPEMMLSIARKDRPDLLRYFHMKDPSEFDAAQCWFGSHLITDKTTVVNVVESEKTAIGCRILQPQRIWLATGGVNYLRQKFAPDLSEIHVNVFPDIGTVMDWNARITGIKCKSIKVVPWYTLDGVRNKMDILDFFIDVLPTYTPEQVTRVIAKLSTAAPKQPTPTTAPTPTVEVSKGEGEGSATPVQLTERDRRIRDALFGTPALRKFFDRFHLEVVDVTPEGYPFPPTMSDKEYSRRLAAGLAF